MTGETSTGVEIAVRDELRRGEPDRVGTVRPTLAVREASPHAARVASLDVESIDLAALTEALRLRFAGAAPVGYLDGMTQMRDAVVAELGCSELEAESVVDTLVARGFARYDGDPSGAIDDGRGWWLE